MSGQIVSIRADVIEAVADTNFSDGCQISFRLDDGTIHEEIFDTSYDDVMEALSILGAEIVIAG